MRLSKKKKTHTGQFLIQFIEWTESIFEKINISVKTIRHNDYKKYPKEKNDHLLFWQSYKRQMAHINFNGIHNVAKHIFFHNMNDRSIYFLEHYQSLLLIIKDTNIDVQYLMYNVCKRWNIYVLDISDQDR